MGKGLSPSHYRNMALCMKRILDGEGELRPDVLAEATRFLAAARDGEKSEKQTAAFILSGTMHFSRKVRHKLDEFAKFVETFDGCREFLSAEKSIICDCDELRAFFSQLREIGYEEKLCEIREYGYWRKRRNRKKFWERKIKGREP